MHRHGQVGGLAGAALGRVDESPWRRAEPHIRAYWCTRAAWTRCRDSPRGELYMGILSNSNLLSVCDGFASVLDPILTLLNSVLSAVGLNVLSATPVAD